MSAQTMSDDSSPPGKGSLQKWWKRFNKKSDKAATQSNQPVTGVFGVSLQDSLRYASVAISQVGPDGKARIYGHIPIVVAKTGLYLKENGTTTQGVFRVSGSNKRIKELEQIFDSRPSYGKNLTWDSFSVHDAASVFRRYLNMLPEPIIPFDLYSSFEDALPRQEAEGPLSREEQEKAVAAYKSLINSLPPASQHIFFYVLDLLGVFARRSDQNLMPAGNLATIFQPGLLRHEPTAAAPNEDDKDAVRLHIEADAAAHKRSQQVLEFLIHNQSSFELELPPHVTSKKAKRKSGVVPTIGSLGKSTPLSTSTAASPKSNTPAPLPSSSGSQSKRVSRQSMLESDEENDWAAARREVRGAGPVRRGSDQSEDRRRMRRKKAEQKQAGGQAGVKRSRTLPSGKEGRRKPEDTTKPLEPLKPRATTATPARSATIAGSSSPALASKSPALSSSANTGKSPAMSSSISKSPAFSSHPSPALSSSGNRRPVDLKVSTDRNARSPPLESASDMSVSPTPDVKEKNRWWRSSRRASIDPKGIQP